jgi:RND family efflux transporter MFP subunit
MRKKAVAIGLIIGLLCISVVVLLCFVIYHMVKTDPTKARLIKGKMPVSLAAAKMENIHYVIGASGQTQEFKKVNLTAKVDQPVAAVSVKIGDIVQQGQVLVRFRERLLEAIVDQAKSDLSMARSELYYSKLNYERFLKLYNQKLIAKVELEEADQRVKRAEYEYSSAVRKIETALQDLDYATVRSPCGAIILDNPVTVGEIPKLNGPLLSIGVIDDIYMLAKVAEEKISYVHLKMNAEVLFDSYPNDAFKGEITKIDPNTDPQTRTFIAYIEIPNKDLRLTPGLTGFARINYTKNSLTVPSISVINPVGENAIVFVVDADSVVHIKRVKTGLSSGGLTEILEGLKEGDKIAFAGVQALQEGDKVEAVESQP